MTIFEQILSNFGDISSRGIGGGGVTIYKATQIVAGKGEPKRSSSSETG